MFNKHTHTHTRHKKKWNWNYSFRNERIISKKFLRSLEFKAHSLAWAVSNEYRQSTHEWTIYICRDRWSWLLVVVGTERKKKSKYKIKNASHVPSLCWYINHIDVNDHCVHRIRCAVCRCTGMSAQQYVVLWDSRWNEPDFNETNRWSNTSRQNVTLLKMKIFFRSQNTIKMLTLFGIQMTHR